MTDRKPTDRERVETALPGFIFMSIISDVRKHESDADIQRMCDEAHALLQADYEELMADVTPRAKYDRLRRRIERAYNAATGELYYGELSVVILTFRLFVERLQAEDYLTLVEGSRFDQAWMAFAEHVEASPEAGALDSPDVRGQVDATHKRLRQRLSGLGLYR